MRIYVGFDDTDNLDAKRGTGKLARWFEQELPEGCRVLGVVRQQLFVHESIPYTSHNSSACVMIDAPDNSVVGTLIEKAVAHLEHYSLEGSDPGLCVACEGDASLPRLVEFGRKCTREVMRQKDAMEAASCFHLSGHGGTNDGIIGAAAGVGLTFSGWCGRFIEYGRLRDFPEQLHIAELERSNMVVVSVDRNAEVPAPEDLVNTGGWLRPRLWGDKAVVPVVLKRPGVWECVGKKKSNGHPSA